MQGDNIPSPTDSAHSDSECWDGSYINSKTKSQQSQNKAHRIASVPVPSYLSCGLKRRDAGLLLVDALKRCSGHDSISYTSEREPTTTAGVSRIIVTDEAAIAVSAAVTDILHMYVQKVKYIFCTEEDQKRYHTRASLEAVLMELKRENPVIERMLSPEHHADGSKMQ